MRRVRTTDAFWEALELALPEGSGPSAYDFVRADLSAIMERLADHWDDELPLVGEHPRYRQIIDVGKFCLYAVDAQLAPDGAVELIHISIDLAGLAGSADEDPQ